MTSQRSDNPSQRQNRLPAELKMDRMRQLIQACAAGDQDAFKQLYESSSAQLLGVLIRMLPSKAIAEEVLQETYIKIWDNLDSYNAELGNPTTWMISIGRNCAIDTIRKRNIREHNEIDNDYSDDIDTGALLGQTEQSIEDIQILSLCLERLEAEPRDCIIKAYCAGYSHEELSQTLQTPLGTIKSWIRRGLMALRGCIDELS